MTVKTSSYARRVEATKLAKRSGLDNPGEREIKPWITKVRALIPKGVNSVRPRDANIGGQPSKGGEANIGREETESAPVGPVGVEERARAERTAKTIGRPA